MSRKSEAIAKILLGGILDSLSGRICGSERISTARRGQDTPHNIRDASVAVAMSIFFFILDLCLQSSQSLAEDWCATWPGLEGAGR